MSACLTNPMSRDSTREAMVALDTLGPRHCFIAALDKKAFLYFCCFRNGSDQNIARDRSEIHPPLG